MKILILSRYSFLGASSRVRFFQYIPYFQAQGAEVTISPLFCDDYLTALYSKRSLWRFVLKGALLRVRTLFSIRQFDTIIIEKELFPYLPAFFETALRIIGVPFIVDYDDAIFHNYDVHSNWFVRFVLGRKIDTIMRSASTVVTGNNYLADRARSAGAENIVLIPTVVDIKRYICNKLIRETSSLLTIGWIGTPKTSQYLKPLIPVFKALQESYSVRFIAIGADSADFKDTPVDVFPWTEANEVEFIQLFDIGIMPLFDSLWERGKCGYKLIQYMACTIPVVASPVGVNCEIVEDEVNGKLALSDEEWYSALSYLLNLSHDERKKMGRKGLDKVVEWYSLEAQAPRFYDLLLQSIK